MVGRVDEPVTDAGRRPVGRPPKINREMIAEAAHELGLADLTLRGVADRLGVSVAGLYHHIDGKNDLMRLAAEHGARRTATPHDRGQHWAVWLREWAHYNRRAFTAEPELLGQFLEGAISADAIADNADSILGLLVREGFTVEEADAAYDLVSSYAVGSAVIAIRERRAASEGRPFDVEYERVLSKRAPDELPHLRALVRSMTGRRGSFEEAITTVLAGIAARRGESWEAVRSALDAADAG
jgi:AcrR family transcriptional regulator